MYLSPPREPEKQFKISKQVFIELNHPKIFSLIIEEINRLAPGISYNDLKIYSDTRKLYINYVEITENKNYDEELKKYEVKRNEYLKLKEKLDLLDEEFQNYKKE
jgi:hypothetical protein